MCVCVCVCVMHVSVCSPSAGSSRVIPARIIPAQCRAEWRRVWEVGEVGEGGRRRGEVGEGFWP